MNIALILSGGIGSRVGADIPKQYIEVNNQMIITYCLRTICEHPMIDVVFIVAEEEWHNSIMEDVNRAGLDGKKIGGFAQPGSNRQLSIYNGLKKIKENYNEDCAVLIHDAARPMLSSQLITSCINALEGHDGVLPVLPMKDTVYLSEDGKAVSGLLDRRRIFAGQAPEVFRLGKYLYANERLLPEAILSINGSTEPAVMAELDISMIVGDEKNVKITSREDLEAFRRRI
ncbi:MAG: IspD/TarI family cytidylyltransferase [Eubacteriales bacterium]|nr:IspD/TarI family cytidylyltransferase [Eubacteriales bacterium]